MTEKNYTEYERDLRDFEKKPLAKDRETLIFPPQSAIKKSEDQEASVLPVSKLSMRKEAEALHEKDKVRVTDSNSYYYGQEGRVTGSHFSQSGDSEVRFTVEFEDGSQGKFGEKQLQKTFSNKNKTKKISVNVGMRKEASTVESDVKSKGFPGDIQVDWTQIYDNKAETVQYAVIVWDTEEDEFFDEWKSKEVLTEEAGEEFDAEAKAKYEEFLEKAKGYSEKKVVKSNKTKKIAVDDKILTSTKKTARIVAISDDIVFWVSIDGEKDFGSDFVEDIEPFEEHEPFEKHRRERGHEPADEGIVKEIPLEETIELANKNRRKKKADYEDYDENEDEFADIEGSPSSARIIDEIEKDWDNFEKIYSKGDLTAADALSKWLEDEDRDYAVHVSEFDLVLGWLLKDHHRFTSVKQKTVKKAAPFVKKAGTWSLPFTPINAAVLENIVNSLENEFISVHEAKEKLHAVCGDDELFDNLTALESSITERAAEFIRSRVGVLIDDYDTDPENFDEELDPEARDILNRIVSGE